MINVYILNNKASKSVEQKLIKLKEEINRFTIMVEDLTVFFQ